MFLAEQVIRLIFSRRRTYSIPYFLDAICRRFGVQMDAGMCEHVGSCANEILALVTGLVAGNLKELNCKSPRCPHSTGGHPAEHRKPCPLTSERGEWR